MVQIPIQPTQTIFLRMVDITFVYQKKSYKVNVEVPLTFEKLVSAVTVFFI